MSTTHSPFDLTVITATRQRPAQLANCLAQFRQQSVGDLRCEHLVISDGIDPQARSLCQQFGARYIERPTPGGQWGSLARDLGIHEAAGRYVCFWDDDNLYEPHALACLYAVAVDVEIGVVQTRYRCRTRLGQIKIPRVWNGSFRKGDVDTMCVCVRCDLALKETWEQHPIPTQPTTDWHWLQRLEQHQPRIRFAPLVIGWHL
jgi:glycosyltransferase involved in cell wall biosynthesis